MHRSECFQKLGKKEDFETGLFSNLFKGKFEKWVEGASYEELSEAYEKECQEWIKEGYNRETGEKTVKMKRLENEINKRVAEKWASVPRRNNDPNFRWTDANRWDKD